MSELLVEHPAKGVILLRLNRPEAKNALSQTLRELLAARFDEFGRSDDVNVVVVTGGLKVFAAGADIKEIASRRAVDMLLRGTHRLWQQIADFPKPIISAVNGPALGGGCELAMHSDIIIAGESAQFGQPEIRVGIMPGAGGTQRLVRAVGKYKAMHMLLTGRPVSAREAEAMGLVSAVVQDDLVESTALDLAKTIAAMPPIAVTQIKEVVLAGLDAPLNTALMLERKAFQLLFDTQDQKEGMTAFIEKRAPRFTGL